MNELLAVSSGIFLAAMTILNGLLSKHLNLFEVTFIVHFIGMVMLIVFIKAVEKKNIKMTGAPMILYFVGLLGVFLVAVSSLCFGKIGATATMALSIAGQISTSALVDYLALFGVKKVPFYSKRIISFAIIYVGLALVVVS